MTNEINEQRGDLTSCSMVEKSSVKEVNIQNKVNPLFEMKWKDKIESQFLHGTKKLQIFHMSVRLKRTVSG